MAKVIDNMGKAKRKPIVPRESSRIRGDDLIDIGL